MFHRHKAAETSSYDIELREWVETVSAGRPTEGPNAWDGFVAQVVSDAALASLHHGGRTAVEVPSRPGLYASAAAR